MVVAVQEALAGFMLASVCSGTPNLGLPGVQGTGLQFDLDGNLYPVREGGSAGQEGSDGVEVEVPDNQGRLGGGQQGPLKKESRRRKWSRCSRWLKSQRAGYLDIGQYYSLVGAEESERIGYCQTCWNVFNKGDTRQLRSYGCKDRVWCPGCCVFHRDTLAKEAAEAVLLGIEGLEITQGLRTSHFGLKVVCPMPKATSAWVDAADNRVELLNGLFHAKQSFLRKWIGKGVGGVSGLDFAGESNPTEAHYHANSYVFPAKRTKNGWVEVPRWVDEPVKLRRLWAQELRAYLGEDAPGLAGLEEADVWINYLSGPAHVHHWMRYLYRSPLYDLWKGWQSGSVADGVEYQVWKDGKLRNLHLSVENVGCAMQRVGSLPKKWKRVRWFGCFSDGQRRFTMESLGLVGDQVDRDAEESEGWALESGPYSLVRYRKGGGLFLRHRETGVVYKSEDLVGTVNYSPEGVLTGKRQRWRRPGARDGPG